MALTREEAIRLHRELWTWLADNPEENKVNWPGWAQYGEARADCFCCEYANQIDPDVSSCSDCPIEWPNSNECSLEPCNVSGGLYRKWLESAGSSKLASSLALQIANLPEREVQ